MLFNDPTQCLQDIFGHEDFRDMQGDVVQHVVDGGDALVLFPTGRGKSICYQVPALCRPGVAIVVSPLISLMNDQIDALTFAGVEAVKIDHETTAQELREISDGIEAGEIRILYISPERLGNQRFRKMIAPMKISLIAIDEAHCVSEWGHDFRPAYRELSLLRETFPGVPRIALTATADPRTRADLLRMLDMADARVFQTSFDRPNISYAITERKKDGCDQILEVVKRNDQQSGIVYCASRNTVEKTAAWLRTNGVDALAYHSHLSTDTRSLNQEAFMSRPGVVMVATVAFGMGIDKPDVRFVVHQDHARSVEAYYQETGRAGRDGLPSETLMLDPKGQISVRRRTIAKGSGGAAVKRSDTNRFDTILGICETVGCRRRAILAHFGEAYPDDCGNCDNCHSSGLRVDGTLQAQRVLRIVQATGGRFQIGDVVQACLGSASSRMSLAADLVTPCDELASVEEHTWSAIVRQLIADGSLYVDHAAYGALRMNDAATSILTGERRIDVRQATKAPKVRASKPKTRKSSGRVRSSSTSRSRKTYAPRSSDDSSRDRPVRSAAPRGSRSRIKGTALYEALRRERARLAREERKEEFKVIHDSALVAMSEVRPRNGTELLAIRGVGPAIVSRYGARFLSIISAH